ncbi:MAG: hypothetical protein AB1635_12790 [Acidobacteriota bacterium]
MPRSFARRAAWWCTGVIAIAISAAAQAQRVTVEQQKDLLFRVIGDVLRDNPDAAAEVRVLGVGSWMKGSGVVNDIDATLGHPNPRVQERLVRDINARLAKLIPERDNVIKLIHHGDTRFDELFRGEAGQKFVLDYATSQAPDGLATFAWTPEGTVVQKPATSFWRDTGRPLPTQITQPQRFFDDNYLFVKNLQQATGLSDIDRALSTAKYLNNIDQWLVPGLEAQYQSGPLDVLRADAATRATTAELVRIKAADLSPDERRAAVARALGVSEGEVDAAAAAFMRNAEAYLVRTSDVAGFIDGLGRAGKLQPSAIDRTLTSAAAIADRLGPWLGETAADRALRLADVALVAYRGATEGWQAGLEEAAVALMSWGVPQAVLPVLVAEIGRSVVGGGVTWAGNALIFDALNERRLLEVLDPRHPVSLFGTAEFPDGRPNPFAGLSRETLYYRFPERSAEDFRLRITPWAEAFIQRWREAGGTGFATAGAGALTADRLARQLAADWLNSRRVAESIRAMQIRLQTPVLVRPAEPLSVQVDGIDVPRVQPFRRTRSTVPGRAVTFTLSFTREFGTERFLRSSVDLVKLWGELGGVQRLTEWLRAHREDAAVFYHRYDGVPGQPPDLTVDLSVRGAEGWSLTGRWPASLGAGAGGVVSTSGSVPITHGGPATGSPYKSDQYRLVLTPRPNAGPVTVLLTVSFTDRFDLERPVTTPYRIELEVSVDSTTEEAARVTPTARNREGAPGAARPGIPPPTASAARAACEASYLNAVAAIQANRTWNYSGLPNWSDGCSGAESALVACIETGCGTRRDSGVTNSCTDGCKAAYRSACTAENLSQAEAERDRCVAQAARGGLPATPSASGERLAQEAAARTEAAEALARAQAQAAAAEARAKSAAQAAAADGARDRYSRGQPATDDRWRTLGDEGRRAEAARRAEQRRAEAEREASRRKAEEERRQRENQARTEAPPVDVISAEPGSPTPASSDPPARRLPGPNAPGPPAAPVPSPADPSDLRGSTLALRSPEGHRIGRDGYVDGDLGKSGLPRHILGLFDGSIRIGPDGRTEGTLATTFHYEGLPDCPTDISLQVRLEGILAGNVVRGSWTLTGSVAEDLCMGVRERDLRTAGPVDGKGSMEITLHSDGSLAYTVAGELRWSYTTPAHSTWDADIDVFTGRRAVHEFPAEITSGQASVSGTYEGRWSR